MVKTHMEEKKLHITGTFPDEISHNINHQNWGEAEWKKDFQAMKSIGIDTVILVRCGYKKWITYPYIDGKKALMAHTSELTKNDHLSPEQHEAEWDKILGQIKKVGWHFLFS